MQEINNWKVLSQSKISKHFYNGYLHRVVFSLEDPKDQILAVIEFVRLANMCNTNGMKPQMAQYITHFPIGSEF